MKLIPKAQYGIQFTPSDNTRVAKPIFVEKIKYKPKSNEFFFTDRRTGKKTLLKKKDETVSTDNRNNYQKQQDWNRAKQIQKQQEQDKNYEKGIETINSLTKLVQPSTYIGPIFNDNGKSYTDNLISGEGTGDLAGNTAIDLLTPFAVGGAKSLATGSTKIINKGMQNLSEYNRIYKINKELNKGIKENSIIESYNKIAANKDIGTVGDYLDFLDNIFPESKMTGVYYHGGPKGITQFKTAKSLGKTNKGINSGTKDYGIYFADDKELANYYFNTNPKSNRELYTVKLNMSNPVKIKTNHWYLDNLKGTQDFAFDPGAITQKWYDKLNLKQYNSIYHNGKNVHSDGEIVMFNPQDIHIMGTPQESAMFREYKKFPIKHQIQFNENIPIMQQQYDFGFKNIIKAAEPAIVLGGIASSPLGLIAYDQYRKKRKKEKKIKQI